MKRKAGMITTDFRPGAPCWLELNTPDVPVSSEFYRRLFGWVAVAAEPAEAGYLLFYKDGGVVGAIGPLDHEQQRPAWTLFFATTDVHRSVEDVERFGGTVLVEPFALGTDGSMAYFIDPQGGVFGVWEPGSFPGFAVVDEADTFGWADLWTTDALGAQTFYRALLGWESEEVPLVEEEGEYIVVRPSGTGGERAHGGLIEVPSDRLTRTEGAANWHPTFMVTDCDVSADMVREGGGRVLKGPEDAPKDARIAICADPMGAEFLLLQPTVQPYHV